MEDLLGLATADNVAKLILIGVVWRSLKQSLDSLNIAVDKLADKLDLLQQAYNDLSIKIAKVEESAAAAHKRIDEIISKG